MLLSLSKYKILKKMIGSEITFQGNKNIQSFHGTIYNATIKKELGEIIVALKDNTDQIYDINIQDINIKDLELSDNAIELYENATAVLTRKEFISLYYENNRDGSIYQSTLNNKDNTIWSTIKLNGELIMVNGNHKDAVGLNNYSEFSYYKDSKIIVLLEDKEDSLLNNMLETEKSKKCTISHDTFNKKYIPFSGEHFEGLHIGLYLDAIIFIKKYIGVPDDRDLAIGAFLWSNIDSTTIYDNESRKGCTMLSINGYHYDEFGFTIAQLPWKNLKEVYYLDIVGSFYPLENIIVD